MIMDFSSNTVVWILVSLLAGTGLGLFYFGGLWFTLKQTVYLGKPSGTLALFSFITRTAIVLAGMVPILGGGILAVLAAMAGMAVSLFFLFHLLNPMEGGA